MRVNRSLVLAVSGVVVLASGVGLALGLTGGSGGPEVGAAAGLPASSGPLPVVFDEASAALSSQDAYSTTSVDANGVYQTVLSPTVVNVKVGGVWVPASATLTDDGDSGLEALRHPLALSLAPMANDPELVSASSGGYSVTFALKGAAGAPLKHVADPELPSNQADHAVYAEVFPGTDLVYDVSPSVLKESVVLHARRLRSTRAARRYKVTYVTTVETRDHLGELAREARAADVRLGNAVAARILDGATQLEVARILGVSQSAVSQTLRRRRERMIGPYWTIPVLAGRLASAADASTSSLLRLCAQFVSDFRRITDPIEREAALGAPEATGAQRLDCLVAGLADREARRAGLATPEWAVSARYDLFPSWFVTSSEGLVAWLLSVTPPEFAARGVFLDPSELESV